MTRQHSQTARAGCGTARWGGDGHWWQRVPVARPMPQTTRKHPQIARGEDKLARESNGCRSSQAASARSRLHTGEHKRRRGASTTATKEERGRIAPRRDLPDAEKSEQLSAEGAGGGTRIARGISRHVHDQHWSARDQD